MSPLFRKSDEKAAHDAATQTELERLRDIPAAELGVELLPALGPDGIPHARGGVRPQQLCKWLMEAYPGASKFNPGQLLIPVREALQSLEHAELVYSSGLERTSVWRLTRAGEDRLASTTE